MRQFLYREDKTGKVYDEIFSDDKGTLLEYDYKGSYGDPDRRTRGWVTKSGMEDYKEYVAPVVEVRYADACLVDYTSLGYEGNGKDFKQHANTTWWTRKRSGSDDIKATWIDGKLTSVEIV